MAESTEADGPATRNDLLALFGEFRAGMEAIAPALQRIADSSQPGRQVQHVTMPAHPPAPARGERLLWAMAALVLLMVFVTAMAVVVSFFQGQRVTDLRTDMQAERARSEAHEAWAREEAQIVRGYIWKGAVPRLNPYPNSEAKK